ncbi:hypothetical protein [Catellatospora tritici]|uniref:hypothetical protein n=1 Tax=Catellatospora tritici TaxID=2851566 RepID=UPI001C2D621B|nr:hypothetical protein [Catellatospora tritici]MBV1852612.1 hypothetical protein [Catellatospora tritici]
MSRRASGIVLFVLSFPLLMLGITAWKEAAREADVRAWQLQQAAESPDPAEAERFISYAESTLWRQEDAEHSRNLLLAAATAGVLGGIVVLVTGGRRRDTDLVRAASADTVRAAAPPPASPFTNCAACRRQISVAAVACPQCGHPNEPVPTAPAAARVAAPPARINKAQRAFYAVLITLGLGSAVVIYTVLFDDLSETDLVRISPFWLFPAVFGYYGLVAQRMEAKLQDTHLDTVSDQLLEVIKGSGFLGQMFAFLIHAPFLLVKSNRPWVTALVGSLIWAMALTAFFELVFPTL